MWDLYNNIKTDIPKFWPFYLCDFVLFCKLIFHFILDGSNVL
jgi:hypothetical protein